jgi:hypothetical protein
MLALFQVGKETPRLATLRQLALFAPLLDNKAVKSHGQ